MGDLAPRVAVALVGIPAVLAILYFGGWVLGLPLAVLAAVGAAEVSSLAQARQARPFAWLAAAAAFAAPTSSTSLVVSSPRPIHASGNRPPVMASALRAASGDSKSPRRSRYQVTPSIIFSLKNNRRPSGTSMPDASAIVGVRWNDARLMT